MFCHFNFRIWILPRSKSMLPWLPWHTQVIQHHTLLPLTNWTTHSCYLSKCITFGVTKAQDHSFMWLNHKWVTKIDSQVHKLKECQVHNIIEKHWTMNIKLTITLAHYTIQICAAHSYNFTFKWLNHNITHSADSTMCESWEHIVKYLSH